MRFDNIIVITAIVGIKAFAGAMNEESVVASRAIEAIVAAATTDGVVISVAGDGVVAESAIDHDVGQGSTRKIQSSAGVVTDDIDIPKSIGTDFFNSVSCGKAAFQADIGSGDLRFDNIIVITAIVGIKAFAGAMNEESVVASRAIEAIVAAATTDGVVISVAGDGVVAESAIDYDVG